MVNKSTTLVKLPHHNSSTLGSSIGCGSRSMSFIKGSGMGSVLLRPGGGGSASSYMDMDDYIATTGINPYTRAGVVQGKGLADSIASKLSKLNIAPPMSGPKKKNIVMCM